MTEPNDPYTFENGGRLDNEGTRWYACDPYPTWYRWVREEGKRGELITTDLHDVYYDNRGDTDWIEPTPFPGWAE